MSRLVVCLEGGQPWGFRLQGGRGTGQPLTVSKVRRKSRSYGHLREGDQLVAVNDASTRDLTYDQVMDLADKADRTLTLEVIRNEPQKEHIPVPRGKDLMEEESRTSIQKEIISDTETHTIVNTEKEDVRIQSATLLPTGHQSEVATKPDPVPAFSDLAKTPHEVETSSSRTEDTSEDGSSRTTKTTETFREVKMETGDQIFPTGTETPLDLFPSFSDLLKTPLRATSATKTEETSKEGASVVTKSTEMYREVVNGTETRREEKTTSSSQLGDLDLNELISATQRTLDSFGSPARSPQLGLEARASTLEEPDLILKKKKMFSSSSFYEEPGALYPTVEEQVEMARKIADSLAADSNSTSKGASMFYKRVKRSSKWIHEGPEPDEEEESDRPPQPHHTGPPCLKLVLDQRHPMDLNALRSSGMIISEHNTVSPEVCHGIVKDLHSPVGKGAALFAKRAKKAEEWVVDEEHVRAQLSGRRGPVPAYDPNPNFNRAPRQPEVRLLSSPWDAALQSPLGLPDAAFAATRGRAVLPDVLADTVIRAAEGKRAATGDLCHAAAPRPWAAPYAPAAPTPGPPSYEMPLSPTPGAAPKKMVFQNFNTLPRLWKGVSG